MGRNWTVVAWSTALIAAVLVVQAAMVAHQSAGLMEDQSRPDPPLKRWETNLAGPMVLGATGAIAIAAFAAAFTAGKARRQAIPTKQAGKAGVKLEEDEEERLARPPGFVGPKIRTRRKGAGALLAFNIVGLLLLAGGIVAVAMAVMNLEQTQTMGGRGRESAASFAILLRLAGLPGVLLGGLGLGIAWGRYFPLGELEVISDDDERARAKHVAWSREG